MQKFGNLNMTIIAVSQLAERSQTSKFILLSIYFIYPLTLQKAWWEEVREVFAILFDDLRPLIAIKFDATFFLNKL